MNERQPALGYRRQEPGDHAGRFEVESQVWRSRSPILLAQYGYQTGGLVDSCRVTVEAFKPDARVTLRLTIGFRPENGLAEDSLDFVTPDTDTVRTNLADTKIWLAGCDEYGAGLRECEDLVGTEAVPIQMIRDGLWGAIYEVDVDCKAVRARIDVATPGIAGKWLANAKWCATGMMSDRDWLHARERMQMVARGVPRGLLECFVEEQPI